MVIVVVQSEFEAEQWFIIAAFSRKENRSCFGTTFYWAAQIIANSFIQLSKKRFKRVVKKNSTKWRIAQFKSQRFLGEQSTCFDIENAEKLWIHEWIQLCSKLPGLNLFRRQFFITFHTYAYANSVNFLWMLSFFLWTFVDYTINLRGQTPIQMRRRIGFLPFADMRKPKMFEILFGHVASICRCYVISFQFQFTHSNTFSQNQIDCRIVVVATRNKLNWFAVDDLHAERN